MSRSQTRNLRRRGHSIRSVRALFLPFLTLTHTSMALIVNFILYIYTQLMLAHPTVSSDGYVHPYLPLIRTPPPPRHVPNPASDVVKYEVSRAECLGDATEPAWDLFRRALVEKPGCGDCCE